MTASFYDIDITTIDGARRTMADYRGRTLLIVNVASHCGYTPQYAGLEALYRTFSPAGLVVLGFPCDQFGHQEPGSEAEIHEFCTARYDVTFPLFAKIAVNGPSAHPLFVHLARARAGLLGTRAIKWNFTKFLVSASGEVVARFGPRATPARIEPAVRRLLQRSPNV